MKNFGSGYGKKATGWPKWSTWIGAVIGQALRLITAVIIVIVTARMMGVKL